MASDSGTVPEYGAIFMSNTSTKKECFTRKLFGLPSSQASFVKQVKDGMILFLFEFEKRELHGVFRACGDGAVNIVPNAFSSSGKKFPAQVKFTKIWHCKPLSEHVFRDAIRDNYFSSKKFNFGLCRDQVHRLLLLFSSRKLKDLPERQSARRNIKRSPPYYMDEPRRSVGDSRILERDKKETNYDADYSPGPLISNDHKRKRVHDGDLARTDWIKHGHKPCDEPWFARVNQYRGDSLGNSQRAVDNDWFAGSGVVQNERKSETGPGQFILAEYPRYTLSEPHNVADDNRFATYHYRLGNGCDGENGNGRPISTEYLSSFRSTPNGFECQSNAKLDTENTIKNQLRPLDCRIQSQFPNHANLNYHKDAMVRSPPSCHPLGPPSSSLSYSTSRQDSIVTSSETCRPFKHRFHDLDYANIKSSPYNLEAFGVNLDASSSFAVKQCSDSAQEFAPHDRNPETLGSFSMASIPEKRTMECSQIEGYRSFSFSKPSFGTVLYSESGNGRGDDKEYASSSVTTGWKSPSMFNCGYPVMLHDKYENEIPLCENREAFAASVPFLSDNNCRVTDYVHSAAPESDDYHEYGSVNFGVFSSQNSPNVSIDSQKSRTSVFARLSLAPQVYTQQNSYSFDEEENNMDMSVDEVMKMLPKTSNQKLKAKKSKLVVKGSDDVKNNWKKVQTTSFPKPKMNCSPIISKDMKTSSASTCDGGAEETPYMDFKRRSEVRKINDEMKNRGCVDSNVNRASSGEQCKRRKLIRPNFGKIVSSVANDDSVQNIQILSEQRLVVKDNSTSCKVLDQTQVMEKMPSQNVELSHKTCSIGRNEKNCDMEGAGLICEVERKVESGEGSLRKGVGDQHGIQGSSFPVSQEVHEQKAEIGVPNFELECDRMDQNKLLQKIENPNELCLINGEMAIGGMITEPSNLNLNSETKPEKGFNVTVNGGSEGESSLLSLLNVRKQSRASAASVECSPVQETFDHNIGDAEALKTAHGGCAVDIVRKVENKNEHPSRYMTSEIDAVLSTLSPYASERLKGAEVSKKMCLKNVGDMEASQTVNGNRDCAIDIVQKVRIENQHEENGDVALGESNSEDFEGIAAGDVGVIVDGNKIISSL